MYYVPRPAYIKATHGSILIENHNDAHMVISFMFLLTTDYIIDSRVNVNVYSIIYVYINTRYNYV